MENKELLSAIKDLIEESNQSLRNDMRDMKNELNAKIDNVRDELHAEISSTNAKIDNVREDLHAEISSTKDEIIKTIKQNNVAIAEIVTEASEKTVLLLSDKIDDLSHVSAQNCFDITALKLRAK